MTAAKGAPHTIEPCFIGGGHPVHDWTTSAGERVRCPGIGRRRPRNGPRAALTDQEQRGGATLTDLLCHPDVDIRPDFEQTGVALLLPSHLATRLAALLPDPQRRDQLTAAAHTIAREEDIAVMDRRDLLRTDLP